MYWFLKNRVTKIRSDQENKPNEMSSSINTGGDTLKKQCLSLGALVFLLCRLIKSIRRSTFPFLFKTKLSYHTRHLYTQVRGQKKVLVKFSRPIKLHPNDCQKGRRGRRGKLKSIKRHLKGLYSKGILLSAGQGEELPDGGQTEALPS